MSIAINAIANLNYGGALVSEKYNPLDKIRLKEADKGLCSKIFTNRSELLEDLGLQPGTLELAAINWSQIVESEKGRTKPPLVVVSSNRSKWIKAGIEAGDAKLKWLQKSHFDGVIDLRALQMKQNNTIHPPIYSPNRIERPGKLLDRNVYIVVASSEFRAYHATLDPKGITVIGWNFEGNPSLNGFGASRFAAIQFCKTLRTKAGNPWDYIWLFDDNVVAIEPFIGLYEAEKFIKNGEYACFGFHGAKEALPNDKNNKWAWRTKHSSNDNYVTTKGILQQAVLWNIKYLTDKNLNFPPIFLASAEDVSLSRYFDRKKTPYRFYNSNYILKEVTTYDGHSGLLPLADYFAKFESIMSLNDPPPPPPPVSVQTNYGTGTVKTFVVHTVLPHSNMEDTKAKAPNAEFQNKAACQAVEQIMKVAIQSEDWVDDAALTSTFVIAMNNKNVFLRSTGL